MPEQSSGPTTAPVTAGAGEDAAQEVDAALREARMLLSMLSAPALRAGIGAALQGEAPTDPAVAGPLSRLAWLTADGAVDHALLRARVDALGTLLGDGAILSARRLTSLPVTEEERRELAGRIVRLAWERLGSPRFVTEPELTAALAMFSADAALVRRAAVDAGALRRTPDGSRYELATTAPEQHADPA